MTQKPKLVVLIDRLGLYGAERVCIQLMEELIGEYELHLVTYSGRSNDSRVMLFPGIRHHVVQRHRSKFIATFATPIAVRRLIKIECPGAVLSFMTLANILACFACFGSSVRVVLSEHNILTSILPASSGRGLLMRALVALLYRRADTVVCVTNDVREDLARVVGSRVAQKCEVIHNPVNIQAVRSGARDAGERALASSHIAGRKAVLLVGAMKAVKGHDVALAALLELPPEYVLVFVGDGGLRPHIENRVRELGLIGRVIFAGSRANPYAWMAEAHVVIVPSAYEGFGLVVVEAAVVGARIVAASVKGLREVVPIVGGQLIPGGEASALARAICSPERHELSESRFDQFRPTAVARHYRRVLSTGAA